MTEPINTTQTPDPNAAPATAAATPSPTVTQNPLPPVQAPVTPTVTPAAPIPAAANQPHPLARALDAVLKTATGGDVYYTDPTGQRKIAPQSRGTLGKTLIAATLAGLLAPDKYTQTPYGPRRDFAGTGAGAVAASQGVVNAMRNRPQAMSDEMQTKKLLTIQNNARLVALQSASAQMKHTNYDQNVQFVKDGLSPFQEYENLRTSNNDPTQPKAFNAQGLTSDQVMSGGHKMTDSNILQDGWVDKWNDNTKQMEKEPTYAILNPELKDVTLPKNVTDMLNRVNSQWKDIHSVVGGTVKVPVNAYVSAMHDYQAVQDGANMLNDLSTAIGGKEVTMDAVAAAARAGRDNKQDILPTLYQLAHGVGAGNTPDQRPDNLLHVLQNSNNGNQVLKLLGLTPDQADKKMQEISNERVKATALAKEGGVGDKSPAPPEQIQATRDAVSALPIDDQQSLKADFNPNGTTVGELKHINDKVQQIRKDNKDAAIKAGDPAELKLSANNIIEGDTSSVKDLLTSRLNVRQKMDNILQQEARDRDLDPTRYTLSAQQSRADMYKDYSETATKTGQQITSFGAFLGHINAAYDSSEAWTRSGSELVNHYLAWLAKNASNDQDYKRFATDIIAPMKEYMTFLNNNRAEHEADIQGMEGVLSGATTPAGAITALKSLAKTADLRMANIGQRYIQTVGTTYPVVNQTGVGILDRMLGKGQSQAAKNAASIPRGWKNNQASPLNDPRALQTIFDAAGRDPVMATRIAKENGWIVPNQK